MRLVITGTEKRLVRPSKKDLALPDWDNSYLEWVDLSGLTVPPMRDADVFHYRAAETVFDDTDWTQFRFPIDNTNSQWAANLSSYNHDGVVEVLAQATNATRPGVELVHDHVGADYGNSWQDSMWRLRTELGMANDDIWKVFEVAFEGYPALLSRLKYHCDTDTVYQSPPNTETKELRLPVTNELKDVSLSGIEPTGFDRHAVETDFKIAVGMRAGSAMVRVHVAQLHPHLVAFGVTADTVSDDYKDWWQSRWGRG